jgi:DNA-binding LacI/PurR family transcriptional regulator
MADVARHAGVSRALVSIVFRGVPGASEDNRRRVLQAAEELGYRPDQRARLLRSARSGLLGVVFSLHRQFHGELVEQLYAAVDGTGSDLALGGGAPSRDERRAVASLLDYRCEALVLLGPALPRAALEELTDQVPVVVVARSLRSRRVDVVRTDDVAGARLAVEHLADLGHEDIAHLDGGRAAGAAERRRGYLSAMHDLGLTSHAQVLPGGLTAEKGEAAAAALLHGRMPSAVTVFNDNSAAGLLATVRARGVAVPNDLSVVGYDDSRVASLSGVRLTTVAQNAAALAKSAVRLALARARDEAAPERTEIVVPPQLVVRSTTTATTPAAPSDKTRKSPRPLRASLPPHAHAPAGRVV